MTSCAKTLSGGILGSGPAIFLIDSARDSLNSRHSDDEAADGYGRITLAGDPQSLVEALRRVSAVLFCRQENPP